MNFKAISLAAASAVLCLAAVSCDKKNELGGLTDNEKEMKNIVEQYVPNVIYSTYGDLAKETGELYDLLAAAAEGGVNALTQAQLDAICAKFLQARQSWDSRKSTYTAHKYNAPFSIYYDYLTRLICYHKKTLFSSFVL